MAGHMPGTSTAPATPAAHRPWALSRMRTYPVTDGPTYSWVEIDPVTQTARYFDSQGWPVAMPRHGTSTGTNPPTATQNPGDGRGPATDADTGNDNDE